MDRIPEKPYKSLEETSCVWIETVDNLEQLNEDLKLVNEFAVDLEHHNFRSFQVLSINFNFSCCILYIIIFCFPLLFLLIFF